MTANDIEVVPQFGAFANFGGRYVSELLWPALAELADASRRVIEDQAFRSELRDVLRDWAGRPTPLTAARNLSRRAGLEIWFKREDLLHGGAHKTNNALGQALLAQRLGKRRLLCETGAGQHGVATAMAGARLGLEVVVYMGARDIERQATNVERMRLFGAEVRAVAQGSGTLKDAINEALRDWAATVDQSHYVLGSACGPDPFPTLVHRLQAVIGEEIAAQFAERAGGQPDAVIACVGGGSNAIGAFSPFLEDPAVALVGVEPLGSIAGRPTRTERAAPGLLHGARTLLLQDRDGQVEPSSSIAPGLDYPAIGPEHAALRACGRVRYVGIDDGAAVAALRETCRAEGILPALESAHAIAFALRAAAAGELAEGARIVVNVSGRGDKDLGILQQRGVATTGGGA
ncbi:MAG: tryptophan synthase subunit beta [bacterium]|nr:tryptophan synthase subunit beta [bacterium]